MRTAFTRLLVGAALLCAASAHAAITTVVTDGVTHQGGVKVEASGVWSFSSRLTQTLQAPPAILGATDGATLGWEFRSMVDDFGEPYEEGYPTVGADVTQLTVEGSTAQVLTATSVGGVKASVNKSATLRIGGGWAEIGGLELHFEPDGSVNILGSIVGQGTPWLASSAVSVNYAGVLFTVKAADVEHPATFAGLAGTQTTTLHNLALSSAGFDALAASWGLYSKGLMYSTLAQSVGNFGDLALTIKVSPVPEPSTTLLLAVGLFGLSLTARRRRG